MRVLTIAACLGLLLVPLGAAQAASISAEAAGTVTVSGSWTVGTLHGGAATSGMNLWSQDGYLVQDTAALGAYGSASSGITWAYGEASSNITAGLLGSPAVPTMVMSAQAEIEGLYDPLPNDEGYWSIGFSWADYSILKSSTSGQVTLTFDYSYLLDTLEASIDGAHAYARFEVALWNSNWVNLLGNKDGFVKPDQWKKLTKVIDLTTLGSLEGGAETTWTVSVTNGAMYRLFANVVAMAATQPGPEPQILGVPEPLTVAGMFLGVSGLVGYVRRRR